MTMNETPPAFDIVLRGYERRQVDEHLATLVNERLTAERRASDLEKQVTRLRTEAAANKSEATEPTYAGLGARVEKILRLAEEEARDVAAEAKAAGERERQKAAEDAKQIRALAEEDGKRKVAEGEKQAERLLEQSRKQATQIRTEATDEATAKLSQAESVVEDARAKAAQIATEVEAKLAKRREQAERDLVSRTEVAERRLMETGEKADQLRLEAQKMRDDAERRAKQLLEAARREAEDLVNDARSKAERTRMESERELAALTHRRDSINAQLSNVREMLATLTGSAAAMVHEAAAMPAQGGKNVAAAPGGAENGQAS
jgi:cell division septum initiation protein DivIVA